MTHRTRRRFRTTLLALVALLLAQWTLVTHACPAIRLAGEILAQAELDASLAAQAAMDCHAAADVESPAPSTSARCLKHCADESSTSTTAGLAAAPAPPPLVVRTALPAAAGPLHWQQAPARGDATAPPISILYCICLS